MEKKGGISLSLSTIITVILSILVLILSIFLIQKTMCGAINGIDSLDDELMGELKKIYLTSDELVVIKEKENKISRDVSYGVSFMVRNSESTDTKFSYDIKVIDLGNCGINEDEAEKWIILGKEGIFEIGIGDSKAGLIRYEIPKDAPLCNLRYRLEVKNSGDIHGTGIFDVEVSKGSVLSRNVC